MPQTTRSPGPSRPQSEGLERWLKWLNRLALLLLLLAVPALSTLAKDSWYLPQTNAGHYLTGAIKMKVVHPRLLTDHEPLLAVAKIIPPQPEWPRIRRGQPEFSVLSVGITVSPQLRSPPSPLP